MKLSLGPSLTTVKSTSKAAVDAAAEEVRCLALTPGSGQAMIYLAKETEARAVAHDTSPTLENYPHVFGEALRSGRTISEVAAEFIMMADQWKSLSVFLENTRLSAKDAINSAVSVGEVKRITQTALDTFAAASP